MFRTLVVLFFILAGFTTEVCLAQQTEQPAAVAVAQNTNKTPSAVEQQTEPKEDWTKLPIDRSVLQPLINGAPLGKGDFQGYTREEVRLQWRPGDPIDMYVVKPLGVEKPRVILYLYSYPSEIDRFMDDGWCKRATSKGVAAVGFISALTGERFRGRPMREWFIPELQESLGSSAHDVQLILDYLASRGDLSADQVGMWGQGSGASIAILAAAADPRIRALDLLNPWGDWPDWLKTSPEVPDEQRASVLTPDFLQKISMLDPVTYLPQLSDRSLRVQQVMDDQDTPAAARDKIAASVPHDRLVQYKDMTAHREAWKVTGLAGWLVSRLLPAQQPVIQSAASDSKQSLR
jgi:hypothetical protein